MPDFLTGLLETDGLPWILSAFVIAGLVRGFTGFGTAMIVIPVGAMFLPMPEMIFVLTLSGVGSSLTLVPKAWGQADRNEVLLIGVAAIVAMPLGVYLLTILDQTTLRWGLTGVIALLLLALLTGWRLRRTLGRSGLASVGASAGLIGGATGLTGPIVILFYLAGRKATVTIRANTILFLALMDVAIVTNLLIADLVQWHMLYVAIALTIPYMTMTLVGQAMFRPEFERYYRLIAYAIIAIAAMSSMPLFD